MFKHRYLNTIHCKVWSLKLREHDNSNSYISNSDNSNSDNSNFGQSEFHPFKF